MSRENQDECAINLEQHSAQQTGAAVVMQGATDALTTDALTPSTCPRCDSQQRELLDQPFVNQPLHRRAK